MRAIVCTACGASIIVIIGRIADIVIARVVTATSIVYIRAFVSTNCIIIDGIMICIIRISRYIYSMTL